MATIDERLESRFSDLIRGYNENKRTDRQALKASLDKLVKSCRKHGVNPDLLFEIVRSICNDKFSVSVRLKMSCCLLPRTVVPKNVVFKCISWMGTKAATDNIKAVLFSWIVAVYPQIDDQNAIRCCLYDFVLHHVGTDAIRRYVCALLTLMTTRKQDVMKYRVQRLLRLKVAVGGDPHLNNLLAVYKFYCPHLVPIPMPPFSQSLPKIGFKMWTDYVNAIHSRDVNYTKVESRSLTLPVVFWATEGNLDFDITHAKKRRRLEEMLPKMENNLGTIDVIGARSTDQRIALQHVSSLDDLLNCLTEVELPRQLLAVLRYPVLRKVFSCLGDESSILLLKMNVCAHLYNKFVYCTKPNGFELQELFLEKLFQFSEYLQESVPGVKQFLAFYLNYVWNGKQFTDSLLRLIPWLRFASLKEIDEVISPLEKHFVSSNVNFKVGVVYYLTELAKNTIRSESRLADCIRGPMSSVAETESIRKVSRTIYLFDDDDEHLSPFETVTYLVKFMDRVCTTGLGIENCNSLLLDVIISFYETVANASSSHDFRLVCVPPPAVIYASLFSFNAAEYSRMCTLICKCTESIRIMKERRKRSDDKGGRLLADQIKLMNRYILDMSDSLWRGRAFESKADTDSVFDLESVTASDELSTVDLYRNAFSLRYHPAFTHLALKFYTKRVPDFGSDVSAFRNRQYAMEFIQFLDTIGLSGLREFITAFMKSVKNRA